MTVRETRVLLVDDHPVIRLAIKQIINSEPDLKVCCEAEDAKTALSMVEGERPDLALLDLSLGSGTSGLDLIKPMLRLHPTMRVLVLSVHEDSLYAERTLREGAKGYLNKGEDPDQVVSAIRTVLSGKVHLSPKIAEQLLQRLSKQELEDAQSEADRLSNREREVFMLIGSGASSREIAERLNLSMKTVDVYRQRIKEKLGLNGSTELARRAVEWVLSSKGSGQPGIE